jgi:hypothetical protein
MSTPVPVFRASNMFDADEKVYLVDASLMADETVYFVSSLEARKRVYVVDNMFDADKKVFVASGPLG